MAKESILRVIWNAHTAFLLCGAEVLLWHTKSIIFSFGVMCNSRSLTITPGVFVFWSQAAAASRQPPKDPPVDVVTVTTSILTRTSVVKPKASTPVTRQTTSVQAKASVPPIPVSVSAPVPAPAEPLQKIPVQKPVASSVAPAVSAIPVVPVVTPVPEQSLPVQPEYKGHCFKDPNFVVS